MQWRSRRCRRTIGRPASSGGPSSHCTPFETSKYLYVHETLYDLKTLASGSWLTRHLNLPVDRFEHCNFTKEEALFGFAIMLVYDAVLQEVSGLRPFLTADQLATFERRARTLGVPYRVDGHRLAFELVK